ncbi:MAG: hypothetical protein ACI8YQ_000239, partial [Polaribacter sp.]
GLTYLKKNNNSLSIASNRPSKQVRTLFYTLEASGEKRKNGY